MYFMGGAPLSVITQVIQDGQACLPLSGHTSQIQGWIQTALPAGPTWQSKAFIGANSCGVDLYDGKVAFLPGISYPRYRMEMQTNDQFWVSYRIFEFSTSPWGWTDITGWKTTKVTSGSWPYTPLLFDNTAEGIFFGATDSVTGVPNWSVNVSNAQCGWF
jgi:hypothetical protein